MSLFTTSEIAAIGLLEQKVEHEMFYHNFFNRFTGVIDDRFGRSLADVKDVPVMPIVVKRQFATQGQIQMEIPMLRNLTSKQILGDAQAFRSGELQQLLYTRPYINQRRSVVRPPRGQSNQLVKPLNLLDQASTQLAQHNARWTEVNIVRSFYEKFSYNVTQSVANSGLGITKVQHPNIFAADDGEITWSATQATYAGNIHAARTNLAGGADSDKMSAEVLINFYDYCNTKEIPFIEVGGYAFRPLLIHSKQARDLKLDARYSADQQQAGVRSMLANKAFNGAMGFYQGFLIYERIFSVFGLDTTSTTTTWGADNPLSAVDSYDVKGAICFSHNAICGGWAEGPSLGDQEDDFGNYKELKVGMIDGYARYEGVDNHTPGSETVNINKSSAILLTHAA